jgi:hypothetical protein
MSWQSAFEKCRSLGKSLPLWKSDQLMPNQSVFNSITSEFQDMMDLIFIGLVSTVSMLLRLADKFVLASKENIEKH